MRTRLGLGFVFLCLAFCLACVSDFDPTLEPAPESAESVPPAPADLVFLSGGVYTVDPQRPWAQAVAIRDGRIEAVGHNDEVRRYVGNRTRVVDLDGRMLLPGFHDAHAHPIYAGLESLECWLGGLASIEAILAKVRACVASGIRRGSWLVGGGWSVSVFPDGNAPKELLDEIASEIPIVLADENAHAIWVNSRALELAGIERDTPDPPAGVIERDASTGEASGTLRESAARLVNELIPPPEDAEVLRGARLAVERLHRAGVTSVVDPGVGRQFLETYAALADSRELELRVVACIEVGSDLIGDSEEAESLIAGRDRYRRARLDPDCIKIFADGVLEGETAALLDPYVGRPGYHGEPRFTGDALRDLVTRFDALGLQVHVHAIGDAAVRSALDAFETAREANGVSDHRHNIAHLQLIHPDDVPRFAALDVTANFQAIWAYPDEYVTELNMPVIGEERMRWMYPIGSVHRAGGRLVLGTDWSVSPPDPLPGIEVGLRRQDPTGKLPGVLNPGESVGLATLIGAYTRNGAYIMHQEDETGSIEVGKAADLVVLERNLFDIPAEEIGEVRILETLIDGRTVFSAPEESAGGTMLE
jgi:predicted amidohydrolase YtcJ